jgi:hypothetical protein
VETVSCKPAERDKAGGEALNAGRFATCSDTGIDNGLLAAPGEVTSTALVYTPGARPTGFTVNCKLAGVGPPPDAESQETGGETLADTTTVPVLWMVIGRGAGNGPPGV